LQPGSVADLTDAWRVAAEYNGILDDLKDSTLPV